MTRMGAQLLFNERVQTRVLQAVGRCTRGLHARCVQIVQCCHAGRAAHHGVHPAQLSQSQPGVPHRNFGRRGRRKQGQARAPLPSPLANSEIAGQKCSPGGRDHPPGLLPWP